MKMKWIPIAEGMPPSGAMVLVTASGSVEQIYYFAGYPRGWTFNGRIYWSTEDLGITAWMPMPEPYKATPAMP